MLTTHFKEMDKYNELVELVTSLQTDLVKFYLNGNKSAATRTRKNLQSVKRLAQEIRVDIMETKNK